jgi:hypothetical protein
MAESSLSTFYDEIRIDLADYLGFTRTPGNWSTDDEDRMARVIKRGLNRFYNPPPLPSMPADFRWSFLSPSTSLDTVASTEEYVLPDDFGMFTDMFAFTDQLGYRSPLYVPRATYLEFQNWYRTSPARPIYFCLLPQTTDGTTGQRFKVAFVPTPDIVYTLKYSYKILSETLTNTRKYPYGGAQHGETITSAIMAAAELIREGQRGPFYSDFIDLLSSSVRDDLASQRYDFIADAHDPSVLEGMSEEEWLNRITATPTTP